MFLFAPDKPVMVVPDHVRHSYDRLAPSYDARWQKYINATLSLALEPLEFTGQQRLLDVACGTGELERRLLQRWPTLQITGIDISPNMLRRAAEKNTGAGLAAAESDHLPFRDGHFNLAVCANAFHYFRRPEASLAEIRRVLRPQGRLVIVDWCDDYVSCKLCSFWLRWTDPAFYRTYSLNDCRRLLEANGLSIEAGFRRRIDWLWGLMCFVCLKP